MTKKRAILIAASFATGMLLCFLAFILAGGGHGTFLPLAIVASPTLLAAAQLRGGTGSGFWFFLILALAPFYWALLAWVATGRFARNRVALVLLLCAQYAGAPIIFMRFGEDAMVLTRTLHYLGGQVFIFAGLYLVAHLIFWCSLLIKHPGD
jgi:hypothetical protein